MKRGVIVLWVLLGLQASYGTKAINQVLQTKLVYVCEGESIQLRWQTEEILSNIRAIKFYKTAKDKTHQDLYMQIGGEPTSIFSSRLQVLDITKIDILDAEIDDAGLYESDVLFDNNMTTSLRFDVSVLTGCPENDQFYAPDMFFKINKEDMKLILGPTIRQARFSTLTLKVIIPQANPPVKCIIEGPLREVKTTGSKSSTKECFAIFPYQELGSYTISVNLEYKTMKLSRYSVTNIQIEVLDQDRSVQVPTTTKCAIHTQMNETITDESKRTGDHSNTFLVVALSIALGIVLACSGAILVVLFWRIKNLENNSSPRDNNCATGAHWKHADTDMMRLDAKQGQKQRIEPSSTDDTHAPYAGKSIPASLSSEVDSLTEEISVRWEYDVGNGLEHFKDSNEIESAFRAKRDEMTISFGEDKNVISFSDMIMSTPDVSVPIYRRNLDLPDYWCPNMNKSGDPLYDLQSESDEYKRVETAFQAGLDGTAVCIIKIKRVQNPSLYRKFSALKKSMIKNLATIVDTERNLWHGVSQENVHKINERGFFYNRGNVNSSTKGIRFSVQSKAALKSDTEGHEWIFYTSVLVGESTEEGEYEETGTDSMSPIMSVPAVKSDSLVDDAKNPTEYTVFKDYQAYPDYVIEFNLENEK